MKTSKFHVRAIICFLFISGCKVGWYDVGRGELFIQKFQGLPDILKA
jgi:hypothetical protein